MVGSASPTRLVFFRLIHTSVFVATVGMGLCPAPTLDEVPCSVKFRNERSDKESHKSGVLVSRLTGQYYTS